MTAIIDRLLKYPHAAVFDKSPQSDIALRVRNPHGLVWQVTDTVLHLVTGQNLVWDGSETFDGQYNWGVTIRDYDLTNKTVAELIDELQADGHDVVFENPDMGSLSAHVLVSGAGNQDESNGDNLHGYTSLLWSLYASYAVEVKEAERQVQEALRQMVIPDSEGEWLDVWAGLYGVPRLSSVEHEFNGDTEYDGDEGYSSVRPETDKALQKRIPEEAFRLRVNALRIEEAVKDLTGEVITVNEPWKQMFTLDWSALSGGDRLHDGEYYTYHVIQPIGSQGTDWSKVLPVIMRNKAAGIDLYAPMVSLGVNHITIQPPVEYKIEYGQLDTRGSAIYSVNDMVLGIMRLDVSEPIINHLLSQHHWMVLSMDPQVPYNGRYRYNGVLTYGHGSDFRFVGLQYDQQIMPKRDVAMASMCLSDGVPLGDENAIFSRGMKRVDFDPGVALSDKEMMLSGYDANEVVELVERVVIQNNPFDAGSTFTAAGELGHTDTRSFISEEGYPQRFWITSDNQPFDGSQQYDGLVAYTGYNTDSPEPNGWDAKIWLPDWRISGVTVTHTSL